MIPTARWTTFAVLVIGLVVGRTAAAADGEALYASKTCIACHGAQGAAPIAPGYPKLAGQDVTYLVNQIKDIRDGRRTNGQTVVMQGIVAALSDADIAAIAAYLSGVK